MSKYYGYCYMKDDTHTEPVILDSEEDALTYILLQRSLQHKVRIMDEADFIVMEVVEGKATFPPELVKYFDERFGK